MQAQKSGITQPSLDAKYVKRSKLKDYLPSRILKPDQKTTPKVNTFHSRENYLNHQLIIRVFSLFELVY